MSGMPTFGMLFEGILFILALWWLKEMLGRVREDWIEVRNPETELIPRLVLIGLWLLTALVALFVLSVAIMIITGIVSGLKSMF
ncbi:MAG: hypothetical protein ACP5O1_03055 [Phycisphaerae bacterium]